MRQQRITSWVMACLLLSLGSAKAAYEIYFQSGVVSPAEFEYRIAQVDDASHVVLQFFEPLTSADHSRLSNAGIQLLGYLPERAYAAALTRPVTATLLNSLGVRAMLPFAPEYKLHPRVSEQDFGSWSLYDNNRRMFNVDVFQDVALADAAAEVAMHGFEVGGHIKASHTLIVAADPAKLMELAAIDAVMFINEMSPPLENVNSTVRTRLHVNEVQTAPYNLTGNGVTILVFDGGMVDPTHPDFGARVTQMEAGTVQAHATHVAGTVGGNGANSGGTNRGMAPAATIISGEYDACVPFCFYNSPNDVSDDYIFARENYDVELTTNSVGANVSPNGYPCSWFGDYELTSRIIDGLVRQTVDRPLIQFWAAGNERGDPGCANSSYRCMSIPAGAKNIMTVGATSASDALASFSSWGPTDDGRIKPEVVATGVNVTSCAPGGGYTSMSGTSMATPAAAGVACLILERWHSLYPDAPDPLPETVKALYINSATDLGTAGPDYQSGFGLVNALSAIQQLDAGGVLEGELSLDETYTHNFTVPVNTPTLDVSLAWSDVPALGNVIPTLVNDLDLVLVSPNGTNYLPWTLNPASPGSPAVAGVDSVNVCERVRVANPAAGSWTLRVTGEINVGTAQTFGLASSVPLVAAWTMISGVIHPAGDPNNGVPGSVLIQGEGTHALTDNAGNYAVRVPQGGTYNLHARAFGFVPETQSVVASGPTVVRNFGLTAVPGNGTINGLVIDQEGDPVAGATITYEFPNATIPTDISDASGQFARALPGSNSYIVRATIDGRSGARTVFVTAGQTVDAMIPIDDSRYAPVGPDAYGYFCYENSDTGYAPMFSYTSIAPAGGGAGTLIGPGTGNDWLIQVPLPFNARFYGAVTTNLTVSADGWIGFGNVAGGTQPYTNTYIPNSALPNNAVFVFWDDLYPYDATEGGQVAYYHDAANGRFIVEYYQVPHFDPRTLKVTAQFVLYSLDERATRTGDSEFEIHYNRFDYDGPDTDMDATLGIENSSGTVGLMVLLDGSHDQNQFTIGAGTALRYTTGPILGTGTLSGQITAIPATDLSGATLRVGSLTFAPNADGTFNVADVPAGNFRLEFAMEGYESLSSEQFTVPAGGEVVVNMTAYRLDPPRNLVGDFNSETMQITLNWLPPDWDALQDDGRSSLDELVNYKVYRQGTGLIGEASGTTFVYNVTGVGVFRLWVTAVYDGGESDSSNIVQFIVTPADDSPAGIPTELYLSQNYPNPFNPTTSISFGLPTESAVTLSVFDVQGRLVKTLVESSLSAGHHSVNFDGAGIGSGVYFYRLDAGGKQLIGKMMLLR